MSNNKQSSVEYYINNLIEILADEICNKLSIEQTNRIHFLGKQAKAMHKEETLKLYYAYEDYVLREEGIIKTFGQFYNETFNNNEQR